MSIGKIKKAVAKIVAITALVSSVMTTVGFADTPENNTVSDLASTVASVKQGDIFGDGKVNSMDAIKLAQYLADWDIEFSEAEKKAADVFKVAQSIQRTQLSLRSILQAGMLRGMI